MLYNSSLLFGAQKYLLQKCSPGPALIFEGEESLIASISKDPSSFKVCVLVNIVV